MAYWINRLPTPVLHGKSPTELLFKTKIDLNGLRVFGCTCYPCLRPYQAYKLQYHSEKCTYLGLSPLHKGYKCLSPSGRLYVSRHVRFNESEFPYAMAQNQQPPVIQTHQLIF